MVVFKGVNVVVSNAFVVIISRFVVVGVEVV
jgi:hypothetical protein